MHPQRCGLDPSVGFSPRCGSGSKFCERIGSGHDVVVFGVELVHDVLGFSAGKLAGAWWSSRLVTSWGLEHGQVLAAGGHGVNHVVLVVGLDDANLQQARRCVGDVVEVVPGGDGRDGTGLAGPVGDGRSCGLQEARRFTAPR